VESVGYANDVTTSFQYDNRNRPLSIQAQSAGSDVLSMSYQYDPVGNITEMNCGRRLPDQQWRESQETFEYDWLDRVVSAQGDYGSLSYSYDPVGNRVSQNGIVYTYNEMNELISINDGTLFTYDGNGNTLSKADGTSTWIYNYDSRNQLTEVEKDQHITAQYWYDGDNRRVKKTEWKDDLQEYQTTIYIYSGTNVIYEKNVTTSGEADYVFSSKGLIAKKVGDYVDYYHTDHVGSTRLITDEEGQPVAESEYDPFGITDTEEGYLFNGKEKDSTGLYYYGARYYSPETGRFITRDPLPGKIESPQTFNQYVYCLNNPLKYVDPRGMDCEYVILPDGTISYELAELYNKMQKALETMSEEEWAQLDEYLAPGTDAATKMDAVKFILDKAGIKFKDEKTSLVVEVGTVSFTIKFDFEVKDHLNFPIWGKTTKTGRSTGEIVLSTHIHSGGDLFLVLGHELLHANMLSFHENKIQFVENQFGEEASIAYMELISYQWEINVLNLVPHVTLMQRETILEQYDTNKFIWSLFNAQGVR
jgi:RHS repeat-associated protein